MLLPEFQVKLRDAHFVVSILGHAHLTSVQCKRDRVSAAGGTIFEKPQPNIGCTLSVHLHDEVGGITPDSAPTSLQVEGIDLREENNHRLGYCRESDAASHSHPLLSERQLLLLAIYVSQRKTITSNDETDGEAMKMSNVRFDCFPS